MATSDAAKFATLKHVPYFPHPGIRNSEAASVFDTLAKAQQKRAEFKRGFRNMSALMGCVKCQKCKLHGKLHILGNIGK
jgi:hypothetical protein